MTPFILGESVIEKFLKRSWQGKPLPFFIFFFILRYTLDWRVILLNMEVLKEPQNTDQEECTCMYYQMRSRTLSATKDEIF